MPGTMPECKNKRLDPTVVVNCQLEKNGFQTPKIFCHATYCFLPELQNHRSSIARLHRRRILPSTSKQEILKNKGAFISWIGKSEFEIGTIDGI